MQHLRRLRGTGRWGELHPVLESIGRWTLEEGEWWAVAGWQCGRGPYRMLMSYDLAQHRGCAEHHLIEGATKEVSAPCTKTAVAGKAVGVPRLIATPSGVRRTPGVLWLPPAHPLTALRVLDLSVHGSWLCGYQHVGRIKLRCCISEDRIAKSPEPLGRGHPVPNKKLPATGTFDTTDPCASAPSQVMRLPTAAGQRLTFATRHVASCSVVVLAGSSSPAPSTLCRTRSSHDRPSSNNAA